MGSVLIAFEPVILVLHFIVAFFLIGTILLQAGKGTDISSMFGAGGSQSLFGARGGATFLSKLTTVVAMVFLITSLSLATIANHAAKGGSESSVISEEAQPDPAQKPASTTAPSPSAVDQKAVPSQPTQ